MKKKLLSIVILVIVVMSVIVGGCSSSSEYENAYGKLIYYYDEAHDVGIWTWKHGFGGGMAVVPGDEFENHELPMKIKFIDDK